MDAQEKLYKDGFNSGYFLAQHDPELINTILDSARKLQVQSEYIDGLSIGHDTYIVERILEQSKEAAGNLTPGKEKEPEMNGSHGRQLPVIKFGNTDFTVDVRLEEFRATKAPWNRIGMDELHYDGNSYKFLYDQNTDNVYKGLADINSLPEHVKLLSVPPLKEVDPVGMAKVMGLDDNAFLKKPDDERAYQHGFNSGYHLSKYEPEIAHMLIVPQQNSGEYYQGLLNGKQEYEMEKIKDRLNEISKNKSEKDDKDVDKER